jgi:hypothetical protein
MTAAGHAGRARTPVSLAALWFGLFGAAVAWTIQELAGYALLAHTCYPSRQPLLAPNDPAAWTRGLIVSVLMLVTGLAGGLTAYRSWRGTRQVEEGRARFMALSGMIASSILLFNIVLNLVVLFLVPPCG